jgi:dephospho-CoA kinase
MTKPFVLGLTGSIGMGKSTVADMFEALGVPVFDADAVVHAMQGPDGALVAPIEAAFPRTTGPEGVDRVLLGAAVFDDGVALTRLESIIHPAVRVARREFLREHSRSKLVVFDIPLLFERDAFEDLDAVVVVSAPPKVQRARVLARPGMTPERFKRILSLQMPDAEKRSMADYVIDTGADLSETRKQVAELVENLAP